VKGARPVLRGGRYSIVAERKRRSAGCGGSPTKTRETDGGFPVGLAKNSEPTLRPTNTRDPALLALTRSAMAEEARPSQLISVFGRHIENPQ